MKSAGGGILEPAAFLNFLPRIGRDSDFPEFLHSVFFDGFFDDFDDLKTAFLIQSFRGRVVIENRQRNTFNRRVLKNQRDQSRKRLFPDSFPGFLWINDKSADMRIFVFNADPLDDAREIG